MQFTKVTIENFGIIRALELNFRPGINGIVGPNGSGKSTVLDALCLLTTGVSRGGGKSADNLTWGEKRGALHGEFTHGGPTFAITRAVGKSGQRLVTPDGEFTKQDEIETLLSGILGASMDALLHNTFVPQGAIDSILFATNTQRLREIQQTVGLTRASDGERAVVAEISTYTLTIGLKEQIDSATTVLKASHAEEEQRRAELASIQGALEVLLPYQDVLRRAVEAERGNAALAEAQKQVDAATAELRAAETLSASVTAQQELLKAVLLDLEPEATRIRSALLEADAAERAAMLSRDLRKQLTDVTTSLAPYIPAPSAAELAVLEQGVVAARDAMELRKRQISGETPRKRLPQEDALLLQRPGVDQALKEAKAAALVQPSEIMELFLEISRVQKDLAVFATGECPTCHQPILGFDIVAEQARLVALKAKHASDLAAYQLKWNTQAGVLRTELVGIDTQLQEFEKAAQAMLAKLLVAATTAYDTALTLRDSAKLGLEHYTKLIERQRFIQDRLDKAGASEPLLIDVDALRAKLLHYDRQLSAAATLDTRVQVIASQTAGAKTALRKAQEIYDALGRIDAVDGPTLTEAKEKVQKLQQLSQLRQEVLSKIGILGGRIQETTDQLQRLKIQYVTEEKQATWVQLCKRVRDVMHVNGLPTLLMREYAGVLNRRLAHYLSIWEAPFVMRLDERLAFQVDFADGRSHGADRLSGGQKIVASTSFRLAMADTFAKQVGLLVLDEPSNYLDKDNITHLQGLLLRLKEHASSTGRQIILVTHEESLMGFFDHAITLYQ